MIEFTITDGNQYNETVVLDPNSYIADGWTENGGVYSYILRNVVVGTTYQVTENGNGISSQNTSYTCTATTVDGNTGTAGNVSIAASGSAIIFVNFYEQTVVSVNGNLIIKKVMTGDITSPAALPSAIEFTITDPNGGTTTVILDADYANNNWTFTNGEYIYTMDNLAPGDYTVVESSNGLGTSTAYTCNVSIEGSSTIPQTGGDAEIKFTNNYSTVPTPTGVIELTKTITGPIGQNDIDRLTFTVTETGATTSVWSGSLGDTTLFTRNADGSYVARIEGLDINKTYVVTETVVDVDGATVVVTYTIDGGASQNGPSAYNISVTGVNPTRVAFRDVYTAIPTPTGVIELTKTIEGPVTENDLQNLTFTVTATGETTPVWTGRLGDTTLFTRNADGTYVARIEGLDVNKTYVVTESLYDIDGTTVVVTYSINGGSSSTGSTASSVAVSGNSATTVAFRNAYTAVSTESPTPTGSTSTPTIVPVTDTPTGTPSNVTPTPVVTDTPAPSITPVATPSPTPSPTDTPVNTGRSVVRVTVDGTEIDSSKYVVNEDGTVSLTTAMTRTLSAGRHRVVVTYEDGTTNDREVVISASDTDISVIATGESAVSDTIMLAMIMFAAAFFVMYARRKVKREEEKKS